jgi:hypothetical protein
VRWASSALRPTNVWSPGLGIHDLMYEQRFFRASDS